METTIWPSTILTLGLLFLALVFVLYLLQSYLDLRKSKLLAGRQPC